MNQNFSSKELLRLVKQTEMGESGLTETDIKTELDETFRMINNQSFEFSINKIYDYYTTNTLCQKLVLRKLNNNIKRLYKDEQANRRLIIFQVKTLLEETCPSWILKTDIKKFYESIKRERIIARLKDDAMLSFQSIFLLEKLFSNPTLVNEKGLPRGISISSTLSEMYMRQFDKWIRRMPGVYYYARFVDDIIIFAYTSDALKQLQEQMNDKLLDYADGLEINKEKTANYSGSYIRKEKPLEYLGYKFIRDSQKKNEKLIVSISDKKVNKIKTRIIKSLFDYCKKLDFNLLLLRIKFLTGNYSIRKRIDGNDLRAGIYYNYTEINDTKVLVELNLFFNRAIHSKNGSFGNKIYMNLTKGQKKILCSYSFRYGYLNKVFNSFTFEEMKSIIRIW